jgi:GT2 family glycosyltransferase
MPTTSIIVPHYNDLAGLDRCLAALERQTHERADFTIIVADNGSPQGMDAVAETVAGRAKLILAQERGAGPARNAGVAASSTPYLAFIDSDCVAEPQWLAAGLAGLDSYDFCGGPVHVLIDEPPPWTPEQAFEMVFAFDNESYVRDKGFTGSGNLFTRREVFDTVGGFRVGMSEDLEWSHRATAAGYRLGFVRDAAIGHPARRSWDELRGKWLRIQSETYALKPPTLGNKLRWLARTWAMPLSIVAHAPRVWTHPKLQSSANRRAALTGLARLRLWRWWDGHRLAFGLRRD